jgi:asparagine synthase (glutamine-hydrolysing)
MKNFLLRLKESIPNSVLKSVEGVNEFAILFSGGLDSSLIALLAKKSAENATIMLYTVGTTNSHDFTNSEYGSKLLGMELKKIDIHIEDIINAIPKLAEIINSRHPVKISYELPLYLGMAHIDEKLVLSGQGADELFGGYARYLKMDLKQLEEALKNDVKKLLEKDIEMDYAIAKHFNKILRTPYLDGDVVNTAMQIPVEYKVKEWHRKVILKDLALDLRLPMEIVNKEKKAVQYSSGVLKELRRMAKKKGIEVNELIEHLI